VKTRARGGGEHAAPTNLVVCHLLALLLFACGGAPFDIAPLSDGGGSSDHAATSDAASFDAGKGSPVGDGSMPDARANAPDAFAGETGVLDAADGAIAAGPFTIGGFASGLGLGAEVTLQDNGGDTLIVPSNGAFTFSKALPHGATYDVSVLQSPLGRTCSVSNGYGTVEYANVTSVLVSCR
jgi:hypothetical protein